MSLGTRITRLREDAGMTRAELASRSGISRSTIDDVESHRSKHPHLATRKRIASALQITLQDMEAESQCPE